MGRNGRHIWSSKLDYWFAGKAGHNFKCMSHMISCTHAKKKQQKEKQCIGKTMYTYGRIENGYTRVNIHVIHVCIKYTLFFIHEQFYLISYFTLSVLWLKMSEQFYPGQVHSPRDVSNWFKSHGNQVV